MNKKRRAPALMATVFAMLSTASAVVVLNAQEPFTYQAKDFKKSDLPKGMTAEQYMQQVYQERHYKIKVTFRVVDESGAPVSEADIDVGIDSLLHADGYNNYKGKTDAKGLFTVESRGRGCNQVEVKKKGYYESRPEVKWDGDLNPGGKIMHQNGGFRPWNPIIDVMLKKVGKPIPMIVRANDRVGGSLPKMQEWVGLDLFVGDWIKPYGNGKTADLLVFMNEHYVDSNNYKVSAQIKFPGSGNGVIRIPKLRGVESLLKFPRLAPINGYKSQLHQSFEFKPDGANSINDMGAGVGYFFRIRTQKDVDGKIVSAYYGKIVKNFKLNVANRKFAHQANFKGTSIFALSYYLNANRNDSNLEFDMNNNLAPEVKWKDYPYP